MRKFENIVLSFTVITIICFAITILASNANQIRTFTIDVLNFKQVKRFGPELKKYKSDQKYFNAGFLNKSTGKQGNIEIRLIEEDSPNPDAGSKNYASAWYSVKKGAEEKFYGKHFNYEMGIYDIELRNEDISLQTYSATGAWTISYDYED